MDSGMVSLLIPLALTMIMVGTLWELFDRAGHPGWTAIIPIYNVMVMLDIVGRPAWWIILFFIPGVNAIVSIMLYFDLARSFGQGALFGCGMIMLPFIFLPLLALSSAQYEGPAAA